MDILEKSKYIHFIGIGGIGNSGLAQVLFNKGKKISGSDSTKSEITKSLEISGIKVTIGHSEDNIKTKHELIIYSPAIPKDNPELVKAKKLKIKILSYPEALGELTKNYYTIAIAGTHGKSTTTAITSLILEEGGLDPTVIIGTKLKQFKNQNYKIGKSNYLVIEACEYKRSFLSLNPNILIITNIELDHPDYYKDLNDYISAFKELSNKISKEGTIIINTDDKNSKKAVENSKAQIIEWGKTGKKTKYQLKENELIYEEELSTKNKKENLKIEPSVPGIFNIENAAFAGIAGLTLNIKTEKIENGIKKFKGTWRRMESKTKNMGKCKFIDDYAHHPTEIKATLKAIREENPKAKILCIFQPHQYNRTRMLLKDFGKAFDDANRVIIPNIYEVRDNEEDIKAVSAKNLANEINKHKNKAKELGTIEKTAEFIKENHSKYDIIVTMGAGNIDKIYKMF